MENLENKNEPKLLYRLDKRNPLYVAFDLFIYLLICWIPIIFAIPNFVLGISIFSIILNIVCVYISLIILQILYSIIFFDYFEIYEDKMIYMDILGFKITLQAKQIDRFFSYGYCGVTEVVAVFKKRIFKILPTIILHSLTPKQESEIRNNLVYLSIKNFNTKDKKWKF
ncbi:hypothetical protein OFO07_00205 [Campylobacter sp. JMF_06 NA1]|uniref:hypothetical protein n=1 Tax=Campylobacter sp. JMF_06 NA1 TaxID=2983823 RepID=UPI0022E9FD9E|nr:hypothetical protein [Campylobacter sp. JMF_06 NA1]MDA3077349.1 hypothetical protein [Campylobacter sp. JMF_06 NA1]